MYSPQAVDLNIVNKLQDVDTKTKISQRLLLRIEYQCANRKNNENMLGDPLTDTTSKGLVMFY